MQELGGGQPTKKGKARSTSSSVPLPSPSHPPTMKPLDVLIDLLSHKDVTGKDSLVNVLHVITVSLPSRDQLKEKALLDSKAKQPEEKAMEVESSDAASSAVSHTVSRATCADTLMQPAAETASEEASKPADLPKTSSEGGPSAKKPKMAFAEIPQLTSDRILTLIKTLVEPSLTSKNFPGVLLKLCSNEANANMMAEALSSECLLHTTQVTSDLAALHNELQAATVATRYEEHVHAIVFAYAFHKGQ